MLPETRKSSAAMMRTAVRQWFKLILIVRTSFANAENAIWLSNRQSRLGSAFRFALGDTLGASVFGSHLAKSALTDAYSDLTGQIVHSCGSF
jgi:hypothetical protein